MTPRCPLSNRKTGARCGRPRGHEGKHDPALEAGVDPETDLDDPSEDVMAAGERRDAERREEERL